MTTFHRKISYTFLLEAMQPIAHHMESLGNTQILMRHKVRQPGGGFADVPFLTGDSLRHQMREAASRAYLAAAGVQEGLSESALRLLFNGGMIGGESGSSVSLAQWRELMDAFPPIALFGGCVSNRTIPGRLQVDAAELVCAETWHLLPDELRAHLGDTPQPSFRAHTEEQTRVRMDALLSPANRNLLSLESRTSAENRLLASEKASAENNAIDAAKNKSSMMPRTYETLCTGSLFCWRVTADVYSDLDEDVFQVAVAAFLSDAHVGGKRAVGCGRLKVAAGFQGQILTLAEKLDRVELASQKVGGLFRAHIESRKEQIAKFLKEVVA